MMISFVTCSKCHSLVVASWNKCVLCGHDIRKQKFSVSTETKHLIISIFVFLGVCGLAVLLEAIHEQKKATTKCPSSYQQRADTASNYTASSHYHDPLSSKSSLNRYSDHTSGLHVPTHVEKSSTRTSDEIPSVPDTLDLTRCTDLSYVRESNSVRAYQIYLEHCDDSQYVIVSGELESVVAKNCKRYRKLPSAERAALKKILEEFEQPMPNSMTFFRGRDEDGEKSGPLKIKTASGSDGYVVKLTENRTKAEVEFFFKAGYDVEINVAYGSYTLKYAFGTKWYGDKIRFGLSGSYSKANTVLDFKRKESWDSFRYVNTGHSLTLFKVFNGNMTTTDIDMEDF